MSLKKKLARLKPHISEIGVVDHHPVEILPLTKINIPYRDRWEEEKVFPYFFDNNYCLVREVKYSLSHQHGHYRFQDFLTAVEIWNNHKVNHPLSAKGFQAEELFFFDTETTGLGGGVGNTIFLLGYASVSNGELILRQHILPNPGAEIPLYQSFLEKVNYKTLITYNGKSFDWPQVKTRHTLVREHVPKLPSFGHFDLYHASRRLWKHKLDRVKLSVVESEVLGVKREGDIPGYLAPMIYFDFIENKHPEGMVGILKHNEIDILSLVTLYTHLTFQLCGKVSSQTRNESFEIGRWFASLGENNEAKQVFTRLSDGDDKTSDHAKLALAFQHKKEHQWDKALRLFEDVVNHTDDVDLNMRAGVEVAKILEHKHKNYNLAIKYCQKIIEMQTLKQTIVNQAQQNQLFVRVKRLEQKVQKFPG
jgi:uncharacterized protein